MRCIIKSATIDDKKRLSVFKKERVSILKYRRYLTAILLFIATASLGCIGLALTYSSTSESVISIARLRPYLEYFPLLGTQNEDIKTVRLRSWPNKVENGGDLVVYFKFVNGSRHAQDYLTLSCGPVNGDNDYLLHRKVTQTDATSNSVRFPNLYNMRCDYTVLYFGFNKNTKIYKRLAALHVPTRESHNFPHHVHISLTEDPTTMTVMYTSASDKIPHVQYGLTQDHLDSDVTGNFTTYKNNDMCHAPATTVAQIWYRDPGYMHKMTMKSLKPSTTYFYRVGNEKDGWSKVRKFLSAPKTGLLGKEGPVKFIAYADMGVDNAPAAQSTATRVAAEVLENGYNRFLLHFGDISYARGEANVWDKFFHIIEPYASQVPYMVSIGNHEYDYTSGGKHDPSGAGGTLSSPNGWHPSWGNMRADSYGECSVPMLHRWAVPATGNRIYWYSFNYANIHIIQMSSEHDWTKGSKQYQWLESDLKHVDRSVTPWVILTAHRMMYATQTGMESDIKVAKHFREEVEDLLYKYKVNLMLVGHQHAYERSCPVYKGECVGPHQSATVHVVDGAAGFDLDQTPFDTKYGKWSVSHVNDFGYLRGDVTNDKMTLQFVLNRNGAVYDEFIISKWK